MTVDAAKLSADLEAPTADAVLRAYQRVFATQDGRLVLTHILHEAHITSPRPHDATAMERAQADGEAARALRIAELAGFDGFAVAIALTTGRLQEGQPSHDGHDANDGTAAGSGGFGGADLHPG